MLPNNLGPVRRGLLEEVNMNKHPTETAEYWLDLARNERAFADEDRRRRTAPVESIEIHLRNAAEYEAQAERIRQRGAA